MDKIPDDIMKAAEDALDLMLCNDKESLGSHAAVREDSIKDIARAIFEERKACRRTAWAHQANGGAGEWDEACIAIANDIHDPED